MIRDYTDEFFGDLIDAIDKGLQSAALTGADSAVLSIKSAPGAEGQLIRHRVASMPGNPPFSRTGRLRNSITFDRTGRLAWGFGTALVDPKSRRPYGRFLELGTGKMAPRPFLRPVLVRDRRRLEDAFSRTAARRLAQGVTRG